jgi:hypothetical protein
VARYLSLLQFYTAIIKSRNSVICILDPLNGDRVLVSCLNSGAAIQKATPFITFELLPRCGFAASLNQPIGGGVGFALGCSRKNRANSREASGPEGSV